MKKLSAAFVLLLLVLTAVNSQAQAEREQGLRLNGLVVYLSTYASGQVTAEGFHRVLSVGDKTMEVSLINPATGLYIGYTLEVERLAEPSKLKVFIKPLSAETIRQMRESIWLKRLAANHPELGQPDPLTPPRYPAPQVVNLNDSLKLELWRNATAGDVIGDRLRFAMDEPQPARDFSLNEVVLKLTGFRLLINGETRNGERSYGGFSGPLPWFYVPGKGRFICSIQPHAGYDFQKIGELENNKLSFSYGGDNYEWISQEPILSHRGKWHLWVLHDSAYQPTPAALAEVELYSKGNCCLYGAFSLATQIGNPKQ